jgi:hypothetical protein
MKAIHIEVTNACNKECACCTRFCGHHKKPFFMDLNTVEKALQSLIGYEHSVGIMGGEPTLHPDFAAICDLLQGYVPIDRRGLWTNGAHWEQYEELINMTFLQQNVVYNDHTHGGYHQPLLAAGLDIVPDDLLRRELIDNCWIQLRWSASITPYGCFFCEVAAAQDTLFAGKGGYAIEPGWWKKGPEEFQDQVERYCVNCSGAIPLPPVNADVGQDPVSPRIAKMLEAIGSPRHRKGKTRIFRNELDRQHIMSYAHDWKPWSHRPFRQCAPSRFLDSDGNVVNQSVFHKG